MVASGDGAKEVAAPVAAAGSARDMACMNWRQKFQDGVAYSSHSASP